MKKVFLFGSFALVLGIGSAVLLGCLSKPVSSVGAVGGSTSAYSFVSQTSNDSQYQVKSSNFYIGTQGYYADYPSYRLLDGGSFKLYDFGNAFINPDHFLINNSGETVVYEHCLSHLYAVSYGIDSSHEYGYGSGLVLEMAGDFSLLENVPADYVGSYKLSTLQFAMLDSVSGNGKVPSMNLIRLPLGLNSFEPDNCSSDGSFRGSVHHTLTPGAKVDVVPYSYWFLSYTYAPSVWFYPTIPYLYFGGESGASSASYLVNVGNLISHLGVSATYVFHPYGGSGSYEVIDIWSLMSAILTMPFTFFSSFMDFELFSGTPYAFVPSVLIVSIFGIVCIYSIFKIIVGFFK